MYNDNNDIELYIDSNSRSSGDLADTELEANLRHHSRNFTLSPETTDYDSNCGDLDSLSNDINCTTDYGKLYTSMPVLEDGLSSGHASDTENNCQNKYETNGDDNGSCEGVSGIGLSEKQLCNQQQQQQQQHQIQQHQQEMLEQNKYNNSLTQECMMDNSYSGANNLITNNLVNIEDNLRGVGGSLIDVEELNSCKQQQQLQHHLHQQQHQNQCNDLMNADSGCCNLASLNTSNELSNDSSHYEPIYATVNKHSQHQSQQQPQQQSPPPPPAPQPHRQQQQLQQQQTRLKHPGRAESVEIQEAMKEIRSALQRAKTQPEKLKFCDEVLPPGPDSPIWVPRKNNADCNNINSSNKSHCEEEEQDTDLETDRLLGQQRTDEQDFFDDKVR